MAGTKMAFRAAREQVLSIERLREVLDFSPETGIFRWKVSLNGRSPVGSSPQTVANGYYVLSIDRCRFYQHRLAWFYVNSAWPAELIDHIDGDKRNNRISNLRLASPSQNYGNGRSYGNGKFARGVSFDKRNTAASCWIAKAKDHNSWVRIGSFPTEELAAAAYEKYCLDKWGNYLR